MVEPVEVTVVEAGKFDSLQALQAELRGVAGPVLLVTPERDLAQVASVMRAHDDICLDTTPELLREIRTRKIWEREYLKRLGRNEVDSLTRAIDRQAFIAYLRKAAISAGPGTPVSLILCNVDHFGEFNEKFGHLVGDEMLGKLADCLLSTGAPRATIGRICGDEFGVVLKCGVEEAKELASNLKSQVEKLCSTSGASITISLGVVTAGDACSSGELLEKARHAMFSSKSQGRNRWTCFSDLEVKSKIEGSNIDVANLETITHVLVEKVAENITRRSRKLITRINEEIYMDDLTGCFNRKYIDEQLARDFENHSNKPLSVAFLDLDHFGEVNKQFGWLTGDKLLIEVCELIRGNIRSTDWVGRFGGEEFCLVMPETTAEECQIVLKRIQSKIEETIFLDTNEKVSIPMTVSIGATNASLVDRDYSVMLERATKMTLKAKAEGRNRICIQTAYPSFGACSS